VVLLSAIVAIVLLLLAWAGVCPVFAGQETLIVISVLLFLIVAMGIILLKAMSWLYEKYKMDNPQDYLSSSAVLGQLERLTYMTALIANLGLFLVAWIGIKTFPQWAERKSGENPHAWGIALIGNIMNIMSAAVAAAVIRKWAPVFSAFMRGCGVDH